MIDRLIPAWKLKEQITSKKTSVETPLVFTLPEGLARAARRHNSNVTGIAYPPIWRTLQRI